MSQGSGFPAWVKKEERADAGYVCRVCESGEFCSEHHRVGIERGGSNSNPANAINLCETCHQTADEAIALNLILMSAEDGTHHYVNLDDIPDSYFENGVNPYKNNDY